MYASISMLQLREGQGDEGARLWQENVLPVLHQREGFRELLVLTNPRTNQGMAIFLWETEAHWQATSADPAFDEQTQRLYPLVDLSVEPTESWDCPLWTDTG